MDKPTITKKEGRLKWLCNEAFFGVKRVLPEKLRESKKYDSALAFWFGAAAGYVAATGGESLIEIVNNYGANLPLEKITSHSLATTFFTPIISYTIAPQYIRRFTRENPRYSSGVMGVMFGAMCKAMQVLLVSYE